PSAGPSSPPKPEASSWIDCDVSMIASRPGSSFSMRLLVCARPLRPPAKARLPGAAAIGRLCRPENPLLVRLVGSSLTLWCFVRGYGTFIHGILPHHPEERAITLTLEVPSEADLAGFISVLPCGLYSCKKVGYSPARQLLSKFIAK